MDKDIVFKIGFNVFNSPISNPVSQWGSPDMAMRFESPKSWIEYPLELTKQTFS